MSLENNPFKPVKYYGANIVGGQSLRLEKYRNSFEYVVVSVDEQGAVKKGPDGRFARRNLQDLGSDGVRVYRGPNDNPELAPTDEELTDMLSDGTQITVMPTKSKGIKLNGKNATRMTRASTQIRYPVT